MSEAVTRERLAALRARVAAATPGPWRECGWNKPRGCDCGLVWSLLVDAIVLTTLGSPDYQKTESMIRADAAFVAHARSDLPDLADELERAWAANARLQAELDRLHQDPCLAKAEADEPRFTLLARDVLAPQLVRRWAELREQAGKDPLGAQEARQRAEAMEDWRVEHRPWSPAGAPQWEPKQP